MTNKTDPPAYTELIKRIREASLLGSCAGVLGWDERTYMPRKGSAHRGEQMALLAKLSHNMLTDPKVGECLNQLDDDKNDPHSDRGANVREIRRSYERSVKLPARLVEELARVTTQAQSAWQEAKTKSRFVTFQPWLERILALKKEEAEAVGYKESVYDALLDEFEPGATATEVQAIFASLKPALTQLLSKIVASGRTPKREILEREFPIDRQRYMAECASAAVGFDFEGGRLDSTSHPFCTGLGPGDVRILTRYHEHKVCESFFGALHEAGHGMYEQGLDPVHTGTPLGGAASLGIHESQSRLWENQVGRGAAFWTHFFPRFQQTFPAALSGVTFDDFLFAINDVRTSLIRTDADEVTYNLHIILRFEIEVELLTGRLAVADLPAAWNERFRAMFGISPPDDGHGCLQDIHWSFGGFGYFPTYTLGNLYAAQFINQARKDIPQLDEQFQRGDFMPLKSWLNDRIHRHGQRYRANDLCKKVTGQSLDAKPFVNYLNSKYSAYYGL